MLQEMAFHTKDGVLNYAEGPPAGPPLVLIHGIASRWQVFLPILPDLCLRWHVFALDLRGHGSSSRVPGSYTLNNYVNDVVAFVASRFAEPSVLLGHSMGGTIALLVAGAIPDRVAGVIVGDTPLLADQGQTHRRLRRLVARLRLFRPLAGRPIPEILERLPDSSARSQALAESLHQTDPETLDSISHGQMSEFGTDINWEKTLASVACPVLLLQASPTQGGIATADDINYGLSILPYTKHVILQEAGHDLGLLTGKTTELVSTVLDFLESLHDTESHETPIF